MNDLYVVEQTVVKIKLGSPRNEATLVQATSGVKSDETRAALDYASRVELFAGRFDAKNLFCFPTSTDSIAIGRLTPDSDSLESVDEFYFQCLFVKPRAFLCSGANPATIVHLALNTTRFSLFHPNALLRPFELNERAACVKHDDLRLAAARVGAHSLALLAEAALEDRATFFLTSFNAYLLLSAVFSLLPVHARRATTFSVGLRFRDAPSIRLVGVTARENCDLRSPNDVAESFDLRVGGDFESKRPLESAWGRLVEKVLLADAVDSFYCLLAKESLDYPRRKGVLDENCEMSRAEIFELGERWLTNFDSYLSGEVFYNGDDAEFWRDEDDAQPTADDFEDAQDSQDFFGILKGWLAEERQRDPDEWKCEGEFSEDFAADDFDDDASCENAQILDCEGAERVDSLDEERAASGFFDFNAFDSLIKHGQEAVDEFFAATRAKAIDNRSSDATADARSEFEERAARSQRFFEPKTVASPAREKDARDGADAKIVASLSPFAQLSAEFPRFDADLRRLDSCVGAVVERNYGAKERLIALWNQLLRVDAP